MSAVDQNFLHLKKDYLAIFEKSTTTPQRSNMTHHWLGWRNW